MPTPPTRTVVLTLDGVIHDSDLPVQAFARHLTDVVAADQVRPIIAGMRGFLEGKPDLIPPGIELDSAEDGYQAVEILARAAGISRQQITAAHLASRTDLLASAWAVDEAGGLAPLLAEIAGHAGVTVLAEPGDPAAGAVLAAIGIEVDGIVERLDPGPDPSQVLVIAARWSGTLATAHQAGCRTALVDRFSRVRGTPTYRAADLSGVLDQIRGWLRRGHLQDGRPTEAQDR